MKIVDKLFDYFYPKVYFQKLLLRFKKTIRYLFFNKTKNILYVSEWQLTTQFDTLAPVLGLEEDSRMLFFVEKLKERTTVQQKFIESLGIPVSEKVWEIDQYLFIYNNQIYRTRAELLNGIMTSFDQQPVNLTAEVVFGYNKTKTIQFYLAEDMKSGNKLKAIR
jgi:hypothetical protein